VAVHIGTSGWSYTHWTNVLYPEGLPTERRLDHCARQFQTVELNASYYRWPSDPAFTGWQRRLPDGFVVTVKAPGALTHAKRLYGLEAWLARIVRGLTVSAGCCWYNFRPRRPSIIQDSPVSLSACHAGCASEFRNPTWLKDSTFRHLEEHGAAYCVMSLIVFPMQIQGVLSDSFRRRGEAGGIKVGRLLRVVAVVTS
jgi:uncharacterized protein YecE (DUF72 family)